MNSRVPAVLGPPAGGQGGPRARRQEPSRGRFPSQGSPAILLLQQLLLEPQRAQGGGGEGKGFLGHRHPGKVEGGLGGQQAASCAWVGVINRAVRHAQMLNQEPKPGHPINNSPGVVNRVTLAQGCQGV